MGIIPSSSFKHFVSNFMIAKGTFGYADGVAYYHSENARRIPRIIFFFSGSDNYILLKHDEQLKNPRHHSARILPVTNMM